MDQKIALSNEFYEAIIDYLYTHPGKLESIGVSSSIFNDLVYSIDKNPIFVIKYQYGGFSISIPSLYLKDTPLHSVASNVRYIFNVEADSKFSYDGEDFEEL